MKAKGASLAESGPLTTAVGGHSYSVEVEVEADPGCEAGIVLFYDPTHATGLVLDASGVAVRLANGYQQRRELKGVSHATLRIVNDRQELDFYYKLPGASWIKAAASAEISGMHHNVLGNFLDVRPALYACGEGKARFKSFRYWPEVKAPA